MHHEFQAYDYTNLRAQETLKKKFRNAPHTNDKASLDGKKFTTAEQKQITLFKEASEMLKDNIPAWITDGDIYRFLFANEMDLDKARAVRILIHSFLTPCFKYIFNTLLINLELYCI